MTDFSTFTESYLKSPNKNIRQQPLKFGRDMWQRQAQLHFIVFSSLFFVIRIHSMQTEEPLRRMELQKKEVQKDYNIQEIRLERAYS